MKHRFGPSLYFASDKVIFDSLNQHQVSTEQIRKLLNDRGIIVSADTSKDELAKYASRLTTDYFDHQMIAHELGRVAKRERITYSEIKQAVNREQIIAALTVLEQKLEEQGCNADVQETPGRILARIDYELIDYTKTEFRQVQPCDAIIEFAFDAGVGNFVVRSTQNNFTDGAVDVVFAELARAIGAPVDRVRIGLQDRVDHRLRTQFFEKLMRGIHGHDFLTVTDAYCFKPKTRAAIESDDSERDLEDQPYVERVSLRGQGVNRSIVFDDLSNDSYFIVKVVWRVRPTGQIDHDIYELEAQFSSPATCTDFSYQAKSVIAVENGRVTERKRTPLREEQDSLNRGIEDAAKEAYKALVT